jgi:uncharacterized protein YjbI with pentapeptide repeats
MQAGVCGRPVHRAKHKADTEPVCLMHSKDPEKLSGPLYSEFLLEFNDILDAAGTGTADFTKFVFPHLSLRSREIEPVCIFSMAVFEEQVELINVHFKRDVDFFEAKFVGQISCRPVEFHGKADFLAATFSENANFGFATFHKSADFEDTSFLKGAIFRNTPFEGDASFRTAEFQDIANFEGAVFSQNTLFTSSSFERPVLFMNTTFKGEGEFTHATFSQGAIFPKTKFLKDVSFEGATFGGETHFPWAEFSKTVDFSSAHFLSSVSFRGTHFLNEDDLRPSAVFQLARFSADQTTLFYKTDLSRALFHNCNLSDVTFSSVIWRKRPYNQSLMVFEEDVPLENDHASTLRLANGERDYGLIAQLYQQLKKNYDEHLDYWAADHFHYGEMEMQRLVVPTSGPLLGLRAFYRHHLSLIAWYRRGSNYGNSYLRPAMWLCGILLLFTLLFPVAGLRRTSVNPAVPPSEAITYRTVWGSGGAVHDKVWGELKLVGKSFLATIDTATFQRTSEYLPAYPYGRALAIVETLLTSTVFALFLLAIRRKFRR